jgi:hypothetical protein
MSDPSDNHPLRQSAPDVEQALGIPGGRSPARGATRRMLLTISIVPPLAPYEEHYDYKRDLAFLVEAFRSETGTPTAAIFVLDEVGGTVSLVLPAGQQELTEAQSLWHYGYTEITGYDIEWLNEAELAALFQREKEACRGEGSD